MICCNIVSTFNVSLLFDWERLLADLFSEFPIVAGAAARVATKFFHVSAVSVVAGVACLDSAAA
jgi:hypothetical protein